MMKCSYCNEYRSVSFTTRCRACLDTVFERLGDSLLARVGYGPWYEWAIAGGSAENPSKLREYITHNLRLEYA